MLNTTKLKRIKKAKYKLRNRQGNKIKEKK